MKKTYIAPSTESYQMKVNGFLMGSTDNLHTQEAGQGGKDNRQSFAREFDFFDE